MEPHDPEMDTVMAVLDAALARHNRTLARGLRWQQASALLTVGAAAVAVGLLIVAIHHPGPPPGLLVWIPPALTGASLAINAALLRQSVAATAALNTALAASATLGAARVRQLAAVVADTTQDILAERIN